MNCVYSLLQPLKWGRLKLVFRRKHLLLWCMTFSARVCNTASFSDLNLLEASAAQRRMFSLCVYGKLKRSSIILETLSSIRGVGVRSYPKSIKIKYLKAIKPWSPFSAGSYLSYRALRYWKRTHQNRLTAPNDGAASPDAALHTGYYAEISGVCLGRKSERGS